MSNSKNINTIISTDEFSEDEREQAKQYWANIPFNSYVREQSWSNFIADHILEFKPDRVFEFGCNAGKNLNAIKKKNESPLVFGVDINAAAILHARNSGLVVAVADEHILKLIPDNSYDVSFTISVLDHLPDPGPTLTELGRISRSALIILEPWLGSEGKVIRNFNIQKNEVIDTTPYSYSWDYVSLGKEYLPEWNCSIKDYSLNSNLGRYYKLYTFKRMKSLTKLLTLILGKR